MIDKPRFADGSLVYFGAGFAGLIGLCLIGSLLTWIGLPAGGLVAVFLAVALAGLVMQALSASRRDGQPTAMGNGVAVSMEWLSAFGLFGIVGALYAWGHDGLAVLIGLGAGFVLSSVLIAPRLIRAPSRSLPDFLSLRYASEGVRYLALAIVAVVTVLFVAAQLVASGLIAEHGLGLPPIIGVALGVAGVLILTLPAGMRSLNAGQVFLAVLAIAGVAIATVWLLAAKTGIIVPHVAYGGLLSDIAEAEERLGLEAHIGIPSAMLGTVGMVAVAVCLAIGSAVMPHSVARVSTQDNVMDTERAVRRGLVMFVVVATALPALGVLAKAEVLTMFTRNEGVLGFDALSATMQDGARVCGAALAQAREACAALGYTDGIPAEGLSLDPQRVFMVLPALAGASDWVLALLSLIGLSVAVMAAGGAAQGLASAISSRSMRSDAAREMRLAVGVVTLIAAGVAAVSGLGVLSLGIWAFSLIGASLFAPLVLGLWWKRTNRRGALVGMAGGFVVAALYLVFGAEWLWLGVPPMAAGLFGVVASLFLTFWVSMASTPPRREQVALIEAMDAPLRLSPPVKAVTADPVAPE